MIKVSLRYKEVTKPLVIALCEKCLTKNVYYEDEIKDNKLYFCTKCDAVLSDFCKLIKHRKARMIFHKSGTKHFTF